MYATVFNPSDQPVALGDGSTIGGGEWAPALTTAPGVAEALATGRLVVVQDDGEDVHGPAADAVIAARRYAERSDTTKDLDKAALMRAAVKAELVQEDADINRAELEDLLIRSHADLPKPRTKPKNESN